VNAQSRGGWTADSLRLLEVARQRCARYLSGLETRAVAPAASAIEALRRLDTSLPAAASPPAQTLALLDELVSPATMAMAGPRFFGFVIGGSLPAALAANWLAAAWDQNAAFVAPTPGVARLEQIALAWLNELFDFPPGTTGGFVTGATISNFTALAAARHAVLAREGWNVESEGLFGAPPIPVVVGGEAHPSLTKALAMLRVARA
jgi:glutamate/tyrosine decarboxylase-like PLP-dependent enzyme